MKKVFFALIAVALSLAIVSCDFFAPPEVANTLGEWDDGNGPLLPGEFFVGVNRASGRALTEPLARAGADYFEVVFTDGTNYERAAFREGNVRRMRVPTYDQLYDNSGSYEAYVFAGRNESKTLLGIGMISAVDGVAGETEITTATTEVTFRLEALTTDIKFGAGSTFTISGTGTSILDVPVANSSLPVFMFPKNTATGLAATFNFGISDNHSFGVNLFDAIVEPTGTPAPIITTREYVFTDEYDHTLARVNATFTSLTITGTDNSDANIAVLLNITTPDKDGVGLLYIDIPVYLLDGTNAVTWRLRGGLNNALVDAGVAHNNGDGSQGGAIVTGVGSVFEGAGFEVIANINGP